VTDDKEIELEDLTTLPSTRTQARQWVLGSELADLWQMPGDPTFERDLELMGGEMIDPWERSTG
jgi:hypothetical protein